MAKQLDTDRTRLVFKGTDSGPTTLTVEYSIVDGDLSDRGKQAELEGPDFDATSSAIWNSAISTVETSEGIS